MRASPWMALAFLAAVAPQLSAATVTPISDLSSMQGQTVTVEGSVTALTSSTYERQPNRLTVTDSTGSVQVVIWPDVFGQLSPAPTVGDHVSISGQVGEYRSTLQVRVQSASAVAVGAAAAPQAAPATAPPAAASVAASRESTPLASVSPMMDRQSVTVEGMIEAISPSRSASAPNRLTLRDASGTGTVVIWPEVYSLLAPQPQTGQRLRATGQVGTFRDQAQIACRDARAIQLLDESGQVISQTPSIAAAPRGTGAPAQTAPAPSAGAPTQIAVSDIDASTVGRDVILEGTVAQVRQPTSERAPYVITLSDGTSTIPVVLWSDKWTTLSRPPAQGDHVRVTGQVSLYEQRNEIQVRLESLEYQ
jgi:DNA/RNA endonuclease YhcR with UshA esterase domain